jgi:hypothetical protein
VSAIAENWVDLDPDRIAFTWTFQFIGVDIGGHTLARRRFREVELPLTALDGGRGTSLQGLELGHLNTKASEITRREIETSQHGHGFFTQDIGCVCGHPDDNTLVKDIALSVTEMFDWFQRRIHRPPHNFQRELLALDQILD